MVVKLKNSQKPEKSSMRQPFSAGGSKSLAYKDGKKRPSNASTPSPAAA
jgi:hypothetical protein